MTLSEDRIERYLTDELDECRPEDVQRRMGELEAMASDVQANYLQETLGVLNALAAETRYKLAYALAHTDGELCACELHALVDVSESGLSHALSDLESAGLIVGRKEGRWKKYRATLLGTTLVSVINSCVKDINEGRQDGQ